MRGGRVGGWLPEEWKLFTMPPGKDTTTFPVIFVWQLKEDEKEEEEREKEKEIKKRKKKQKNI